MTNIDYPVYDFLTASKVERPLAAALKIWLNKFAKMFVERWKEFAPTEIKMANNGIDSLTFESIQSRWSEPSIGIPISLNQGAVPGMIVVSRVDMLMLILEILCESLTQRPQDRDLTSIESSLCHLFFEQSVATFSEAWPEKEMLPVELTELDLQPNRSRLFSPQQEVLVAQFQIQTSSSESTGAVCIQWVFSKEELKTLLAIESADTVRGSDGFKISVENVTKIQVDICAILGSAELDMNDLIALNAGDIVKLNQRIEAPITLSVNQQPAFSAWPGRKGDKQCFQVESVLT